MSDKLCEHGNKWDEHNCQECLKELRTVTQYIQVKNVARILATFCESRHNADKSGNTLWFNHWTSIVRKVVEEYMPSGVKIDLDKSNSKKLVFHTAFHHMDENGYYDGWTEHTVTVRAAFDGFEITISGKDRNEVKDHLHEVFSVTLGTPCYGSRYEKNEHIGEFLIGFPVNQYKLHEGMNEYYKECLNKIKQAN